MNHETPSPFWAQPTKEDTASGKTLRDTSPWNGKPMTSKGRMETGDTIESPFKLWTGQSHKEIGQEQAGRNKATEQETKALATAAGVPSNPGWLDKHLLNPLTKSKEQIELGKSLDSKYPAKVEAPGAAAQSAADTVLTVEEILKWPANKIKELSENANASEKNRQAAQEALRQKLQAP